MQLKPGMTGGKSHRDGVLLERRQAFSEQIRVTGRRPHEVLGFEALKGLSQLEQKAKTSHARARFGEGLACHSFSIQDQYEECLRAPELQSSRPAPATKGDA